MPSGESSAITPPPPIPLPAIHATSERRSIPRGERRSEDGGCLPVRTD